MVLLLTWFLFECAVCLFLSDFGVAWLCFREACAGAVGGRIPALRSGGDEFGVNFTVGGASCHVLGTTSLMLGCLR